MTGDQLRKLALSLADTGEAPHFERLAFRTRRRIFATLGPDERSVNLLLTPEQQAALVEAKPRAFAPVAGRWGLQGWTIMTLAQVTASEAKAVLSDAHELALPRKAPRAPAKARSGAKRKRS